MLIGEGFRDPIELPAHKGQSRESGAHDAAAQIEEEIACSHIEDRD